MHILRDNTIPTFEIVPRKALSDVTYFLNLKNEYTQEVQVIECTKELLPNENYNITLATFPVGNVNEKMSFELKDALNEVFCIGQLMIVSEFADVQNYTKVSNTKYYK